MAYDVASPPAPSSFMRDAYVHYTFPRDLRQEIDCLVNLLALPRGASLLEIGCGTGRYALELARRGFRVLGVDAAQTMVEVGRLQAQREGLNVDFMAGDPRDLQLDSPFDAAICLWAGMLGLEAAEDGQGGVLGSLARAVRPGGVLVLTAINALAVVRGREDKVRFDPCTGRSVWRDTIETARGETREAEFYTTAFTYAELKLLLQAAGFRVEAGYGRSAGSVECKPLEVEDIEIVVVARRIAPDQTIAL